MRALFSSLRFFVWLIVPAVLLGVYHLWGLPHFIWSYDWRPTGPNSFAEFDQRRYTRCSFYGPYGLITEYPTGGTCGWLHFAKKAEVRQ